MKPYFFSALLFVTLLIPAAFVLAQTSYVPMVTLPRLDANAQSTEQYVRALFLLSIAAAAILAFIKIIFGGVKWMLSDVITDKQSARNDIKGAIFGLLIVLAAVVVLDTINPQLTMLNILSNAPALGLSVEQQRVAQVQSACGIDPNSESCCISKGGTISRPTSGTFTCNLGEVVPIPSTDNSEIDRYNCERQMGYVWDPTSGQCRQRPAARIPVPSHAGGDGAGFCNSPVFAPGTTYDPATNECVVPQ